MDWNKIGRRESLRQSELWASICRDHTQPNNHHYTSKHNVPASNEMCNWKLELYFIRNILTIKKSTDFTEP